MTESRQNGSSNQDIEQIRTFDDSILSARKIESGYGDLQVLHGVNLDVRENEIVLIFGPNGAGKSTFIKAIYGLLPVWKGNVYLDSKEITSVPAEDMILHGASYVPQYGNVFKNMTVSENLDIGGIHSDDISDNKSKMFDLFPELRDFENRDAGTLSGGERQMLAIARAMMVDPEILFIDEPSAGLAPELVERALEYIERINEAGTSVLMVEQNVSAALEIADRGYALSVGENHFEGAADDLFESDQIQELYLGQ